MKNAPIEVHERRTPSTNESAVIIKQLGLQPHPEGGWYRELYRSAEILDRTALPERYSSPHCFSTSIYFLLERNDFSAFHQIKSDETWHFYLGSPVKIYIISPQGSLTTVLMGNSLHERQVLQYTVSRNCWFAAKIPGSGAFSLVGCTVAPGFEFSDFKLAVNRELSDLFPIHSELIDEFTRSE